MAEENEEIYTDQKLLMPVNPALFKQHKIYTVKKGGEYIFDIALEKQHFHQITSQDQLPEGPEHQV